MCHSSGTTFTDDSLDTFQQLCLNYIPVESSQRHRLDRLLNLRQPLVEQPPSGKHHQSLVGILDYRRRSGLAQSGAVARNPDDIEQYRHPHPGHCFGSYVEYGQLFQVGPDAREAGLRLTSVNTMHFFEYRFGILLKLGSHLRVGIEVEYFLDLFALGIEVEDEFAQLIGIKLAQSFTDGGL